MILSETPRIEFLRMDCMELMRNTPDKFYDLAIVDPPYGIGADKKNAHSNIRDNERWAKKDWDCATPNSFYFEELRRISKNQIIWGGNYFLDYLSSTHCFLIWDKGVRDFSLADAEIAWTSFNTSVRIKTIHRVQLQMEGTKFHPTQKPIKLYSWTLHNYAKPGDKILDTHAGSFSSGIACYRMGFDMTACEIDQEYYDAAVKRFKLNTSQLTFPLNDL